MTRFVKKLFLIALIIFPLSSLGLFQFQSVDAQTVEWQQTLPIGYNNRSSFILNLDEGETLVSWIRFLSGDGIYVYIQNSTERELSQWSLPVSVHNDTIFENEAGKWHYWKFTAPYSDSWSICFSKWDTEPFDNSDCVLELLIGSWHFSTNLQISIPLKNLTGNEYLSFSAMSTSSPLDRVELYIDNEKVNTHWLSTVTLFMYEGSFLIDTLDWTNGNHTLKILVYDKTGTRISEWESQIEISNGFFDQPNNVALLIVLYSVVIFALLMWKLRVKPTDEKEKWLHGCFLAGTISILFIIAGSIMIPGIDSELARGVLFLIGLSLLNSAGVFSTYYLSARYQIQPRTPGVISSKGQIVSLDIDQLLGRSDILDKTRGNLRTGASVVLGIGSGISWWIVNNDNLASPIDIILLVASAGLAVFSVGGLLVSFSHLPGESRGITIGEELIPEELSMDKYLSQLKEVVRHKVRILSSIRQTIGVGMLWFILVGLVGVSLPIYLSTTVTPSYPIIALLTGVPITIMMYAIARLCYLLLGDQGLRLMRREHPALS